jgi:hypothetical protein
MERRLPMERGLPMEGGEYSTAQHTRAVLCWLTAAHGGRTAPTARGYRWYAAAGSVQTQAASDCMLSVHC